MARRGTRPWWGERDERFHTWERSGSTGGRGRAWKKMGKKGGRKMQICCFREKERKTQICYKINPLYSGFFVNKKKCEDKMRISGQFH
ncbi:hypothetical protein SLEP1_g18325 [Rubroshorea leprosula]|uniref:Uncharacterized protein n=1 Tax=Rubroshorea leprosula TaxID=152421 RepID=A0AAV5IX12_9ROSI|nr:hypothetical protein SLEP1_g18325 [Rubroshorea leprosula]